MQKDLEDRKCTHREEEIPVGTILGLVLLSVSDKILEERSSSRPADSQGSRIVLQRPTVRNRAPISAGTSATLWRFLASVEKVNDPGT